MKFIPKPLLSPFLEWATNYEDAWLSTQPTSQMTITKQTLSKWGQIRHTCVSLNCKQYHVSQNGLFCSNNTIYAKVWNSLIPFIIWVPLFYLALLSFPLPLNISSLFPSLVSNPQNSSTRAISGCAPIGRDVCHTDLGWLIAQRTLAPLDPLWSDGLYVSLSLDGRTYTVRREEQSTYLPTLAVASSSPIFLSPISSLTLAVAAPRI